jgi:hypothetical protein
MGRHSIPDPDDQPDEEFGVFGSRVPDEPAPDAPQADQVPSESGSTAGDYAADRGYDDEPAPAPRGFPAVADEDSPTQAFSVTGRNRTWEGGEWTGSHRAVTTAGAPSAAA